MKNKFLPALISIFLSIPAFAGQVLTEPYKSYDIKAGKKGGKLIIPAASDPKSFNPIVAQETSTTQVTSYIFEGLTRTHPLTLEVIPNLADSWETSDGKEWIFHLRQDVKWNDGVKFSAKDVVFTFNDLIYNPDIPTGSRDLFTIEGQKIIVEAVDDYTVKFKLPFVFAPFLRALSQDILPEHKYKKLALENKFSFALALDSKPEDIVGTGPFRIKEYFAGERVILERNPFYYKKDFKGISLPYLDEIVLIILSNSDTSLLKFLEGETDYYALRPQDIGILGPVREKNNFTIYNAGPALGSNFVVFNQNPGNNPQTKKPFVAPHKLAWFQNKKFRQAVSYALNRKKIIDIIMNGLGLEQFSPVSAANTYYHNSKVKEYPYDPEKSKKMLASLGFIDADNDGFLEDENNNKLEVTFFTPTGDTQRVQIASLIKKDLESIGIKVHFLALDFNNLVSKLTATFDWEMILIGLTGGIEPYFGKNVWSYKGNLHMWNYSTEPIAGYERRIEDIFNLSAKTLDETKRKEQFNRWQEIVSEELPLIYTVTSYSIYAVRNRFGNLHPTVFGGAFSEIEHIFIKE